MSGRDPGHPDFKDVIYLDYNASTPVDPSVKAAMLPYLERSFGNPSSQHVMGRFEREAVDKSRRQVADFLGASPEEIIFTSGGTEANNHVIKGVAWSKRDRGRHIITSKVEHPAVINPCRFLEDQGFEVSYVNVDRWGRVDPDAIVGEICPDTILITIMHAQNEVGTVQPIEEIGEIAREAGVWFHTDAAQSCGKIETRVDQLKVDFLTVAGHKVYAPKGIGALYIRSGIEIEPLHHGAGHENGRRAGTEPVPLLVGLGAALDMARRVNEQERVKRLRNRLFDGLVERLGDDVVRLGHPEACLPNTLAVGFRGRIGAEVLGACPKICASTGSACHASERKRSSVLEAIDVPEEIAFGAVRLSVGRFTTEPQIDRAIEMLTQACQAAIRG
jgi:cysteine desulfurase